MAERNITLTDCSAADLAGHCTEMTAWKVLSDVATELKDGDTSRLISPSAIRIADNGCFVLTSQTDAAGQSSIYEAPEAINSQRTANSAVWSLAASIFYMVMGCNVMNGKGGAAQHRQSKVPYMRTEMPELSELIQQCLHYNPAQRPTLQTLVETAAIHYKQWQTTVSRGPQFKKAVQQDAADDASTAPDFWPEEMNCELTNS